jgi:adhesin transport system outer membrane protein
MAKLGLSKQAIAGLVLASLAASGLSAEPLTLAQAQYLALKRSPELGQAQARTGAAEALRDQARREWLPKVSIDAAGGWRHLENDTRINLGFSAIDEKPVYATLGVDQPLFDFGRRSGEIKTQKSNLSAARYEEQLTAEGAAYQVARAYLQSMAQERVVRAAETNLDFHQSLAADVTEGVARGAMSVSERQQASERLQSAKVLLSQAQSDLIAARAELALLIGSDDFDLVLPPDPSGKLPASLDAALSDADLNDPRVFALRDRLDASKAAAGRSRAERWPTLGLRGTIRAGKDFEGYRGDTRDYELLFALRWNLFDGGVTLAKIRQAGHNEDEARFAFAAARRDSELQVRKAWSSLANWRAKFTEQETRLMIAGQVRESYRAQFGIGRRSLLDLLDAQGSVYGATVDTEVARFGTLLAEYGMLAQLNRLRAHFGVGQPKVDPKLYGPQ